MKFVALLRTASGFCVWAGCAFAVEDGVDGTAHQIGVSVCRDRVINLFAVTTRWDDFGLPHDPQVVRYCGRRHPERLCDTVYTLLGAAQQYQNTQTRAVAYQLEQLGYFVGCILIGQSIESTAPVHNNHPLRPCGFYLSAYSIIYFCRKVNRINYFDINMAVVLQLMWD